MSNVHDVVFLHHICACRGIVACLVVWKGPVPNSLSPQVRLRSPVWLCEQA